MTLLSRLDANRRLSKLGAEGASALAETRRVGRAAARREEEVKEGEMTREIEEDEGAARLEKERARGRAARAVRWSIF